jgi:DNA-binding NarL/FixJ family response regulator
VALRHGSDSVLSPAVEDCPSPDLPSSSGFPSVWDKAQFSRLRGKANEEPAGPPITHNIPSRDLQISVAVIDKHAFTRASIIRSLRDLCHLLKLTPFGDCDECLTSNKHYDLILYHMRESMANQVCSDEQVGLLRGIMSIAPVIILSDADSYEAIRAAFENGVRGYIPTANTTPELVIEILYLVKCGGTFVPLSTLAPRNPQPRRTANSARCQQYTPRQVAVLELLRLGKTNKIIAYELGMSESSVKSHIRNLMNKMNVANRTQIACRAQELYPSMTLAME